MNDVLRRIKGRIWRILYDDIEYIILNHFVNHIPCWSIRKIAYYICGMRIGKGSRISMGAIIIRPSRIQIGENSIINENVLLDGREGLSIGNNNSISMYVKIYTGTHSISSPTFEYKGHPTIIRDNCWLGTSSIIMPGSSLMDFTVIGANSVFHGKTEEKDVMMGIPAKKTFTREINTKYSIKYNSWFR